MSGRSPASRCDRIAELAQELALLLEGAADAGSRDPRAESNGRGTGFTDADSLIVTTSFLGCGSGLSSDQFKAEAQQPTHPG